MSLLWGGDVFHWRHLHLHWKNHPWILFSDGFLCHVKGTKRTRDSWNDYCGRTRISFHGFNMRNDREGHLAICERRYIRRSQLDWQIDSDFLFQFDDE